MIRIKLKQFRVGKGMTQAEFAKEIGFTRSYYGAVENGKVSGSRKFWKAISRRFAIPMGEVVVWMLDGEED